VNPEQSLPRVNRAFTDGSLADGLILAIAKSAANRSLNEANRQAVDKGIHFLLLAKEGYQWLDAPRISLRSQASADSFEVAVRTRYPNPPNPSATRFLEDIEGMLTTLRAVSDDAMDRPTSEALKQVREFFYRILRASVGQIDEILSPMEPSRTPEWKPAVSSRT
jgi:hypothetical protein